MYYLQGNNGCYGGLMTRAFQYVVTNNGIDKEDWYKYRAYVRITAYFNEIIHCNKVDIFDI